MLLFSISLILSFLTTSIASSKDDIESMFETHSLILKELDLSNYSRVFDILNKEVFDKINEYSNDAIFYLLDIEDYEGGIKIKLVQHSIKTLPYFEGYSGYMLHDNIPIIICADESIELKYKNPTKIKIFTMQNKNFPAFVYDPQEWIFLIEGEHYTKLFP